jgi:hypothetical protein
MSMGTATIGRRAAADRGFATAELAVALPALLLVVAFCLGSVDAVLAKVRCTDTARDAALVAARGGDGTAVGVQRAPPGAIVVVTRGGDTVTASVSVRVGPFGTRVGAVTVSATAVAAVEPGSIA